MFVETYRRDNVDSLLVGNDAKPIPYPRISQEDWRVWKLFLPVRSVSLDRTAASSAKNGLMLSLYGIPYTVTDEIRKSSQHFDKIEVWRKREIQKDPIAVGIIDNERYMIARWGLEKLMPFSTIKKSVPLIVAWQIVTNPLVAMSGIALAGLVALRLLAA